MTPNPFPAPAPPPPQKKKPILLIILLALGVPLAACLVLGGIGYVLSTGKQEPLKPGDEAAFVTAEALLATTSNDAKVDATKVKQGREKLIAGGVDLSYEYESEKPPLYVSTQISIANSAADAKNSFLGQSVGGAAGLAIAGEGVKLEDRDDMFKWGDQSKHKRLTMDGKPVGHFFIAQKGKYVFTTIFSGIYFDDADALAALLAPRLAAMETLAP